MKYAEDGYEIQTGDIVECLSCMSPVWRKPVCRVTPKRVYVRHNDGFEEYGPRVTGFRWTLGAYSRGISYRIIKAEDYKETRK